MTPVTNPDMKPLTATELNHIRLWIGSQRAYHPKDDPDVIDLIERLATAAARSELVGVVEAVLAVWDGPHDGSEHDARDAAFDRLRTAISSAKQGETGR